jgi:AcrR family transcriptional regulator
LADVASYPRIDPPAKQQDGTYIVRVHRAPGQIEEVPAADLKAARELVKFLERAATMLIPRPEPDPPRREGRPLILTPAKQKRIVEGFANAMTMDCIAARAGISLRTLYRWLEEGERASQAFEVEGDDYEETDDNRKRREFWHACKEANAALQWELIQHVRAAGKREWTSAMTFLERRWSADFGRRMIRAEGEREPVTVVFRRPHMDPSDQSDSIEGANGGTLAQAK